MDATKKIANYRTALGDSMTVELRKIARKAGIKTVGIEDTPVNAGRKADLITALVSAYSTELAIEAAEEARRAEMDEIAALVDAEAQREEAATPKPKPAARRRPRTAKKRTSGKPKCQICKSAEVDYATQGRDSTMCEECYDYAGWENTHTDDRHEKVRPHEDERWELMTECPVCEKYKIGPWATAPKGSKVHAKAVRFEEDAKKAGWIALARNSANRDGVSLVTAKRDGAEIEIFWADGVFQYEDTRYRANGGKWTKIRNASAARKILAAK